jgi:hypothetical protein
MKDIVITQKDREQPAFQVVVTDKYGNRNRHMVTIAETYYDTLTHRKISREKLLELSFAFLLEREPSDAILEQFDLQDIMRYFPEYDRVMRDRIARGEK